MLRIIFGVIVGFISWMILFIGIEKIISSIWPAFGVHQKAFEEAVKNGGSFSAETTMLGTQLVFGAVVSVMAGALSALVSGENSRAPLIVGILLLLMGIAKAAMSWQYVPAWYHVIFTTMLLPLAIVGGRMINKT